MKPSCSGFTLIELIIAISLLGISISSVVYWILQGNQSYVQNLEQSLATELADLYMSEIIATKRWDELSYRTQSASGTIPTNQATIGPEESNRSQYDDCDDYHGFTATRNHTFKNSQMRFRKFAPYTVSVQVYFVDFTNLQPSRQNTDIKRIDVTITWNRTQTTKLSTLLANV